jgi:large subunit ribosomal protein L25
MEKPITLKAERRGVTGKKVKRLRREGWIPGVAYGPGMEALPVQVGQKELVEAYRQAGTSALIGVLLERQRQARPALIRDVQRDPIHHGIIHVDLELVDLHRAITTHVPIALKGNSPVVEQGLAVLTHGIDEIEIRCLPGDVPALFEVDLSALAQPDQSIRVSDLVAPEGVHLLTDAETVIVYATSLRRLEAAEEKAAKAVEVAEEEAEEGEAPEEEE